MGNVGTIYKIDSDEDQMKLALLELGPITVSIHYDLNWVIPYDVSFFKSLQC